MRAPSVAAICCALPAFGALAQPTLELDPVLAAIEQVESSGRPWAILDNSTGQSLDLPSRANAEQVAAQRLGMGHNLDLGLYQINSIQLRRPDVALATIFDPGVQTNLARTILLEFLAKARELYGDSDLAWERAIGAYNDGDVRSDNLPYVARVLRRLGRLPIERPATANGSLGALQPAAFTPFDFEANLRAGDLSGNDSSLLPLAFVAAILLVAAALGLGWPLLIRATLAAGSTGMALFRPLLAPRRSAQ